MTVGLAERSVRIVWHPCTQMKTHEDQPPVAIARGRRPYAMPPYVLEDETVGHLGHSATAATLATEAA